MSGSEYAPPSGYRGMSYPGILLRFDWQQRLWKRLFCSREIHLFDEVWSTGEHYLSCDSCALVVHIGRISDNKGISE